MATLMVAGALLSASFTVVIEKLASSKVLNLFRHRKLDETLLRKLRQQLTYVDRLLIDAEEKQITDPKVKWWLNDLKHAAYEVEDFLDELGAEMEAAAKASTSQLLDMIGFLNPPQNKEKEMASKLEELVQTFEDILQGTDALGLTPRNLGDQERTPTLLNRQTTSLVDDSSVFGRDGDKEAIVELLLSDDAGSTCPGVVSVVGMGGIGKTTLAQIVFNDSRVKRRFDKLKVWICVSEEVDVIKLTKNILKEIGSSNCDSKTPNQLQLELQEKVIGERILLVMDDVWNNIDWEFLLKPLKTVARGSKVLVTTREERVLSKVKGVSSHQLKVLSEEDCWLLFVNHAFDSHISEADANLKGLGTKIIRKCKGLPLAVKTIGSLLCSERRAKEWEKILESNIWDLDDDKIIPALKLSYHYLPSPLKQCFVYCAMFPKDFEFRKEELILLWMAEGFIVHNNNDRTELEEIGEKYFEDLLSRSFFQKHERYGDYFVMHDLLNDLAKSIAGEFCYNNVEATSGKLTEKTRHLFYRGGDRCNILEELENISKKAVCLRTFICSIKNTEYRHVVEFLPRFGLRLRALHLSGDSFYEQEDGINISPLDRSVKHKHLRYMKIYQLPILILPETMPYLQTLIVAECPKLTSLSNSIDNMKDLRHLSLWMTGIESLPDSIYNLQNLRNLNLHTTRIESLSDLIGNLEYLRHLDLRYTFIKRLPESICRLHSLQHLSLRGCKLVELPAKMSDLVNLCHLDIRYTKLKSMPPQMGKLIKLQILSDFIVGPGEGFGIAELGYARNLEGSLCLRNLQNVRDQQDALKARMTDKSCLKELEYVWEDKGINSCPSDRSLLHHLEPHVNIEKIVIQGYRAIEFPNWVGGSSFSNIVELRLDNCKYCTHLPPLGRLPSLRSLDISGFDILVSMGADFYGSSNFIQPFRSLKKLKFHNMPKLQQWSWYDVTAFPLLEDLRISNCPELEMVMLQLFSLSSLAIEGCNEISSGHWDLRKFSSLSEFFIDSVEDIKIFPGMMLLPSTLDFIGIYDLQNLEYLDYAGLHHLTSLKYLIIKNCPNLECMPDEGLPESLTYLYINNCPLLEERCRKEQGEDWPKIARIQNIVIDNEESQSTKAIEELPSLGT